jgi:predicted phosphoribosyltransferase
MIGLPFGDRFAAGQAVASRLAAFARRQDVIVCALPRGGVAVAVEVAKALSAPLTVFMVRKLGVPGHEELAMGALTTGDMRILNRGVIEKLQIAESTIDGIVHRESQALARQERLFCRGQASPDVNGKIVIVADDGIATGSTMYLAVEALRKRGAAYIVVAVPVAPAAAISQLRGAADQVICLAEPEPFTSVGEWYRDFHEVTDREVCQILDSLARPRLAQAG